MNIFDVKSKRARKKGRRYHPARFVYRGPDVMAQQAKIYTILHSTESQTRENSSDSTKSNQQRQFKRLSGQVLPGTHIAIRKRVRRKYLPVIKHIKIRFSKTRYLAGQHFPVGTLNAIYKSSKHRFRQISVTGGGHKWGLTDKRVRDSINSRHNGKYKNSKQQNMPWAIYYYGSQAIHQGSLYSPSHSCVHVGRRSDAKKLNRHSRLNQTVVSISYTSAVLKKLCQKRKKYWCKSKRRRGRCKLPTPCRNFSCCP